MLFPRELHPVENRPQYAAQSAPKLPLNTGSARFQNGISGAAIERSSLTGTDNIGIPCDAISGMKDNRTSIAVPAQSGEWWSVRRLGTRRLRGHTHGGDSESCHPD